MLNFVDFASVRRTMSVLGLAGLFLAGCSLPLFGQSAQSTASLSGIVSDPQGARVGGATVTISNIGQNFTRTFTTESSGAYSFTLLPPAVYALKVEAAGFKKLAQDKITLEVGEAGVVNVSLVLGSTQETVEVVGETPLVTTDNPNIATEISSKQIVELPLNIRNPFFLTFLDSSVRNIDEGYMGGGLDNNDQAVGFLSFGGQYQGWTAYFVDGGWDTDWPSGLVPFVPSVDDVQEFKVQSNSFTAQYGLSAGNVINLVTKSGTSKFHGDLFEFFRNDALDANYYFNAYNNRPKGQVRLNQFGGSEGGPVYIPGISTRKDRTFFYALYEGFRSSNTSPRTGTAPISDFKSGNLSGLLTSNQLGTDALCRPIFAGQIYNPVPRSVTSTCAITEGSTNLPIGSPVLIRDPIAGNMISTIDPVAQNMLKYFPNPTGSGIANNFYAVSGVPITFNEFVVRIDHNFTDSARIFGRFDRKGETQTSVGNLYGANNPAGPGQTGPGNRYSFSLGYSQVFSPTLTASVAVGFQRWVSASQGEGYPYKPSSLGLPSLLDTITPQFPEITFAGQQDPLNAQLNSAYLPLGTSGEGSTPENIGTLSGDITKVHGTHTLSFGYMGNFRQINSANIGHTIFNFNQGFTSGPDPKAPTGLTGDGFASFLLGYATGGNTGYTINPASTATYHGLYIQDDWRATRRLTLNLGMRWDLMLAQTERRNQQAYFDQTAVNPVSSLVTAGNGPYLGELVYSTSSNRHLLDTHYHNFAPRVGFSYQVFKNLIARGGFGIFYPTNGWQSQFSPGYAQGTNYVGSLDGGVTPAPGYRLSTPFPSGILSPIGNSQGGLTEVGQSIGATILQKASQPYVEEWSFGLQYSPTPNDVIAATYIGNHVNHLMVGNGLNLNELNPSYLKSMTQAQLTAPVANPFSGLAAMAGSGCGLQGAMVPAFQLLLPMPQFCDNVTALMPTVGFSLFDSMQVKYTHRSKNLTIAANYTLEKWLDDATQNPGWTDIFYTSITRNNYDLRAEKSLDLWDIPNAATVSFIYNLPVGRGQRFGSGINGVENAVIGGWEFSDITTFKQGSPLTVIANGVNSGSLYGGNQHANIVGNPNVPGNFAGNPGCVGPSKVHTVAAWYNPCAFVVPGQGDFGDAPRYMSNLTAPKIFYSDLAIEKWFNLKGEALRMQFRGEMYNAFNQPILGGPFVSVGTSNAGVLGYADVSRQIQFALKFYW